MNMKRFLTMLLALCMILCLYACGNGDDKNAEDPKPSENTPVVNDPEPSEEDPSEDAPEVNGTVYTITVTDEGGNPVPGAMLQMCQGEICLLPAATDANGVVTFTVTEDGAYEAKFLALPTGYEYVNDVQVFPFDGATELAIVLKAVA